MKTIYFLGVRCLRRVTQQGTISRCPGTNPWFTNDTYLCRGSSPCIHIWICIKIHTYIIIGISIYIYILEYMYHHSYYHYCYHYQHYHHHYDLYHFLTIISTILIITILIVFCSSSLLLFYKHPEYITSHHILFYHTIHYT